MEINQKLYGNVDEVQLKKSSTQMYYNQFDEFDINNEVLHLNRTYKPDNEIFYNSLVDQVSTRILNPNIGHISTSMDLMKIQNLNPPHRILGPSDSINPIHYAGSLLPPPPSSDTMQQNLHHLPSPHYRNMQNMDPLLAPPLNHQQQHVGLLPMMDDGFGIGSPPHHPLMHPSNRQSLLNDPLYLSILDDVRNFPSKTK